MIRHLHLLYPPPLLTCAVLFLLLPAHLQKIEVQYFEGLYVAVLISYNLLEVIMQQVNGHTFRPEEIVSMRRLNRKTGEWSETEYPKIGGRLRIAHEQNDSISM